MADEDAPTPTVDEDAPTPEGGLTNEDLRQKGFVEVNFDYIKGNHYRVVHVDGVIGGLTPNGYIHISIWNQRSPIPRRLSYLVGPEGQMGPEVGRDQRDAYVREVEVALVLDADVATALRNFLNGMLGEP